MIYLFTGSPGAGKTASMINELSTIVKDRPLFAYNVNGLKLPHTELASLDDWMTDCPDGSVIVIDEVQKFWRPAGSGSKVPPAIAALETHRHRGIDFYMTTQGPHLLHSNVRALVERHVHLRNVGVLGRYWYEWPECNDTPRVSWKTAPVKKKFTLPKKAFELYTSAVLHTKPVHTIPRALIILVIAVIGIAYFGWSFFSSIKSKNTASATTQQTQQKDGEFLRTGNNMTGGRSAALANELVDFIPRISGRPWTAPAYDHLRAVVAMPVVSSAICVDDDCKCYTASNAMVDMPAKDCKVWARDKPFNPYVVASQPVDGRNVQPVSNFQSQQSTPTQMITPKLPLPTSPLS